jgi:DNA-binding phage protein
MSTTDDGILREARAARDQLKAVALEFDKVENEYFRAIRSLHGAGVSASEIAEALGLSQERVHRIVAEESAPSSPSRPRWSLGRVLFPRSGGSPRIAPPAKRAIELALREALARGEGEIGTQHLLLGLIREGGAAAGTLERLGADADRIRAEIERRPAA